MKPKVLGKVTQLRLTQQLHERLSHLVSGQGGYQTTCRRILDSIKTIDGTPAAFIIAKDLESLREWANREDAGSWQDWAREALTHNGITGGS